MTIENYRFDCVGEIELRSLVNEDVATIRTEQSIWSFQDGGNLKKIDWMDFVNNRYIEIFKGFLAHRLSSRSKRTASLDIRLLRLLNIHDASPFDKDSITPLIRNISDKDANLYYSYKALLKWVEANVSSNDMIKSILLELEYLKPKRENAYSKIARESNDIKPHQIKKLIDNQFAILKSADSKRFNWTESLVVLVAYELGLRAIQIHALNRSDFTIYENGSAYLFSLRVQNVKKRSSKDIHFTSKAISSRLGNYLRTYVNNFDNHTDALFYDISQRRRLKSVDISKIINSALREVGFDIKLYSGNSPLRHNLAQSLANQGCPADEIASILGHNSLVAAKAYVANVPTMAEIKTRALGKSKRFTEIIDMLITGEPKDKSEVAEDRWVHGVVGKGYIGGIGGCGLPSNNPCPKNPVYSCYTCQKFHPFKDGPHQDVLENLQQEAQLFVDQATQSGDIQFNRSIDQLELTIESVMRTIERFKK